MLKIVFMGTPEFAVPVLESLVKIHDVTLVVTQPDKPKGRGQKLAASPVKEKALELGIPVVQPETLKDAAFQDRIAAEKADLLVVVAFRILPASLFPLARFGAVNIHGSLLPKYRGAAPIQWAVANGETETGVTIFRLDAEVDHGGVLAQAKTPIGPEETSGELFARLSVLGRDLLLEALEDLEHGGGRPREQDHALATPAPKLKKEDGRIDWSLPATALHDRVRAFNPYPTCYALVSAAGGEKTLRIHRAEIVPAFAARPGEFRVEAGLPIVGTGSGGLRLIEVQWEGKPRVSGADLVNGLRGEEIVFA